MSQHNYEMTGVLVLENVTPVITALFSTFHLDGNDPGNGSAYIAYQAESSSNYWSEIVEALAELIVTLGLALPADDGDVSEHLRVLGQHFGCAQDEVFQDLIQVHEEQADVDHLFALALFFDDGHGLTAFNTEAAWHCSRMRLFEFGGSGEYQGKNFLVTTASSHAGSLGAKVDGQLAAKDLQGAAQSVFDEVQNLLAGIIDKDAMNEVRSRVSSLLASV